MVAAASSRGGGSGRELLRRAAEGNGAAVGAAFGVSVGTVSAGVGSVPVAGG